MKDIERRILNDDREWLMRQPQFRRHLFVLLSECGITRTTREEPNVLHLEGRRSLGLEILGWFSGDPAEPLDVIASAIEAGEQLKKGTLNDSRHHE